MDDKLYQRWLLTKEVYLKGPKCIEMIGIGRNRFYDATVKAGINKYSWGYYVPDIIELFKMKPIIKEWDRMFKDKIKELS